MKGRREKRGAGLFRGDASSVAKAMEDETKATLPTRPIREGIHLRQSFRHRSSSYGGHDGATRCCTQLGPLLCVSAKRTQSISRGKQHLSHRAIKGYTMEKRAKYLGSFWKTNPILGGSGPGKLAPRSGRFANLAVCSLEGCALEELQTTRTLSDHTSPRRRFSRREATIPFPRKTCASSVVLQHLTTSVRLLASHKSEVRGVGERLLDKDSGAGQYRTMFAISLIRSTLAETAGKISDAMHIMLKGFITSLVLLAFLASGCGKTQTALSFFKDGTGYPIRWRMLSPPSPRIQNRRLRGRAR